MQTVVDYKNLFCILSRKMLNLWFLFTFDAEEEVIEEEEYIEEDGYLEEEQIVSDDDDDSDSKSSRKARSGRPNGQTRVKRRRVFRIARTTERQRGKMSI